MASRPLFSSGDLRDYLQKQLAGLQREASSLSLDALEDEEQAIHKLCAEWNVAKLDIRDPTTKVEDSGPGGLAVEVTIPFSGPVILFRMRPSSYTLNPPHGVVYGGGPEPSVRLEYGVLGPQVSSETIKQWREREVGSIRQWAQWINHDLEHFSSQLPDIARRAVRDRKALLVRQQQLRDELS